MEATMAIKWEQVHSEPSQRGSPAPSLLRAKVHGGWLIHSIISGVNGQETWVTSAMSFYPDPQYEWKNLPSAR
jgi:hypothetical protein